MPKLPIYMIGTSDEVYQIIFNNEMSLRNEKFRKNFEKIFTKFLYTNIWPEPVLLFVDVVEIFLTKQI